MSSLPPGSQHADPYAHSPSSAGPGKQPGPSGEELVIDGFKLPSLSWTCFWLRCKVSRYNWINTNTMVPLARMSTTATIAIANTTPVTTMVFSAVPPVMCFEMPSHFH